MPPAELEPAIPACRRTHSHELGPRSHRDRPGDVRGSYSCPAGPPLNLKLGRKSLLYVTARLYIVSNVQQGFTGDCYLPATIYKRHIWFSFIFSFNVLSSCFYAPIYILRVPFFCVTIVFPRIYRYLFNTCVSFYRPVPPAGNPTAVNKYIISYHIICHIISYRIISYNTLSHHNKILKTPCELGHTVTKSFVTSRTKHWRQPNVVIALRLFPVNKAG
jgi:hypothetical protein